MEPALKRVSGLSLRKEKASRVYRSRGCKKSDTPRTLYLEKAPDAMLGATDPETIIAFPEGVRPVKIGTALLGYYDERLKTSRLNKKHVHQRLPGQVKFMLLRLCSIERLQRTRAKDGVVPIEDEVYWLAALPCLLRLCDFAQANEEFTWYQLSMRAGRFVPSIFETRSHEWMRTQWSRCAADPHRYRITADEIAWQLQVTNDERLESNLKTIGAIDKPKPERERDRRTKDTARKRAARAAAGATPRSKSKAATKPWKALGLSRAQWYRYQTKTNAIARS
jgi:hypothetical protein